MIIKIFSFLAAVLLSAAAAAQQSSTDVLRIHTNDGETTAVKVGDVKAISFEEVKPLTMTINVESVSPDGMVVDFVMPDGCRNWLLYVSDNPLEGTEAEMRQAVKERFNDDFSESKYLNLQGFKPETTYYIYVLLYDTDGVVAGLSTAMATTAKEKMKDEFLVKVSNVSSSNASVTFTPKDKKMTYYYFVVSEASRQLMISQYGSIQEADKAYWKYQAEQFNYDLESYLPYLVSVGDKTIDVKEFLQKPLSPSTKYYAYCYGVRETDATFTTDVYETEFTTPEATGSDNRITASVTKTYSNGCDVEIRTTNSDKYIVNIQSQYTWERKLSSNGNDPAKAAAEIFSIAFGDAIEDFLKSGDFTGKVSYGTADTDCVLIVCGYDGGVTTEVQTIPFRTVDE